MIDLLTEVGDLRNEIASLGQVASMAHDEAQQAGARMDQMEQEWMTWSEAQQQSGPQGGNLSPLAVPLTPAAFTPQDYSPRAQEAHLQRPLLELEDDPMMTWYQASGTPGIHSSALVHSPPQATQRPRSLSPLGGTGQLCATGVASAGAPPGLQQPAALTAATGPAGGLAGGQAELRPIDHEGQRGGASLVPFAMTDPRPPYASSGSFRGWRRSGRPRPHAGEGPPHVQLPRRTAVWIASTPRGGGQLAGHRA